MGPFVPFNPDDIGAHARWVAFKAKVDDVASAVSREPKSSPSATHQTELKCKDMIGDHVGGHAGRVWFAPVDRNPSSADFWYFCGIAYQSESWAFAPTEPGVPECVAFVALWPTVGSVESVRETLAGIADPLFQKGFRLEISANGRGLSLIKRLPLRSLFNSGRQRSELLEFLREAHAQVVESGTFDRIFAEYHRVRGVEKG